MGGGGGKAGRKTEIKEDFEIAMFTVTQGQWQAVMGNNPSCYSRAGKHEDKVKEISDFELKLLPVENVSWHDAQEFIKKLNEKERGRGYLYRLPSEAEWEYACRAGATTEEECSYHYYFAKPTNEFSSEQANLDGSMGRTTRVGAYPPNQLGLCDMHGNVWQGCSTGSRCSCVGEVTSRGRASDRLDMPLEWRDETRGFRLARVPVREQADKPK